MVFVADRRRCNWRELAVAVLCCVALAGCERRPTASGKGQVVAHVGNEVITASELDNEMRLANVPPEKQKDPETIRKVLGDIVMRKFLVQQAVQSKLDREPGVLLDMLRSREQVLSTAYLNRAAASRSPGGADIANYIADNPAKFAKRSIYRVDQIVFPIGPETQAIVERGASGQSLEQIDQQLTERGVPHAQQTSTFSSADLAPDLVNQLEARAPNAVFFVRAGSNGVFFKVVSSEQRPLTGEAAAEVARQALRADALKAETGVAAFSANSDARYEGDYAQIMGKGTKK